MKLGVEGALERIDGNGDSVKPCPLATWRGRVESVFENVQCVECDVAFRPDSQRDVDEAASGKRRVWV